MGGLFKAFLKVTLAILVVLLGLTAIAYAADPASVPDPTSDVTGFFRFVWELVTQKDWWALAAAVTIGAVALFRKYLVPKVKILQGTTAGWVTTIVVAILLALANAGLAHQAITAKLFLIAIQAGFLAGGGWQFLRDHADIFLKIPILGTILGWLGVSAQPVVAAVQSDNPPPNPPPVK